MNFLAHFHLAWPDPGLVAGGLEGDYYKGPLRGDLPEGIERGVRLHRSIDAFTDAHPVPAELKNAFPAGLRRYAGILIDLSFDHFLSVHWSHFADVPLAVFSQQVYATLSEHRQHLSDGSRRMLGRLVEHDILGLYADWDTVPASARRIGQRFRRGNPFLHIGRELAGERDRLEQAFLAFYPDLQSYSLDRQIALNASRDRESKIATLDTTQLRNPTVPC
jgi:acyl carrier protein phosphodiesterase